MSTYMIEVSGSYMPKYDTIKDKIADMLRYDEGEVLEVLVDEPHETLPSTYKFKVLVHSIQYTPERWRSFMLRTRVVD